MATKKEKILESAQRFVLKGQIDKAIKDYQQVVALDPADVRYRQRLAELLVRDRRKEEAIQQYEFIGKHYADNSYFLKAIAIYKQIQRIAPGDTAVALTVASLNHQQGLVGNALAEYGLVAAQYEKEGALKEALHVVEKMLGVDAEHCATRLKHAELLFATGAKEESCQAFEQLAASLRARGHAADADVVGFRLQQLFPDKATETAPASQGQIEDVAQGALETLECGHIPGADGEAPAPWESADEPDAVEELPDPFDQPLPAVEVEPAPVAGSWDPEPAVAAAPVEEAPELPSWEEEIELDLDDDLPLANAPEAPSFDLQAASPVSAPASLEVAQSAMQPEAQEGIDLQLDFSLELDFNEVVQSLEDEPLDQEALPVVELDLDPAALELTLPQGVGAELPWEELPEPDAIAEAEELPELEDLTEPGKLPQAEEPELSETQDWEAPLAASPDEEPGVEDEAAPAVSQRLRGWEEIYPESDDIPEAELDIQELESHYDLGIGYKEMGMYGGAIKEFDIAARNPQRRLDCLTLQAICYREKGEPDRAEDLLRRGLALEVISQPERVCISYELAVLLEGSGTPEEAIELYRDVVRANPGYHDAARRLSALSGEEHLDIIELELEEG